MATIAVALVAFLLGCLLLALLVGAFVCIVTFAVTAVWNLVAGERVPLIYNLRNLLVRRTTTIGAAAGVGFVVLVLSAALMLTEGIKATMRKSGSPDTAIVLRKGADAELSSSIDVAALRVILAAPGVSHDGQGAALGAGEVVMVVAKDKKGSTGVSNVMVRGVPAGIASLRPEVRVIDGRLPAPGTAEAMIGERIRGRFAGVDLGESFELRKNRSITIVGVFSAAGSSYESEVWADIDTLRSSFGREGLVSSVRARLDSPASYDAFAAFVEQDKRLGLAAMREPVYYQKQAQLTAELLSILGQIIAFLFSLAAMIGATITMYSSVADRSREIGTLRAVGFSRRAILFAFQMESLVLALVGGALGLAGSLALGFVKVSMVNFQTWSELVFAFHPTLATLTLSLAGATVMGLLGGFLPALRAARVSPVQAMRD